MNTLDDLRATLVADAASVEAAPHTARAAGVEGKIRTIRRQRRAGAAVGAAALAAVVGLAVLPNLGDDPRTPPDERLQIAGHVVPQEIEILDFDYRLLAGVESDAGESRLELEIEESDRNHAVAVAVDDLPAGATATLRRDGDLLARVVGPSRLDTPIPLGGDGGTLTLTVTGGSDASRLGLATYERTDELAAGLEDPTGEVVFRNQVADKLLVGGAFLEPGSAEAVFTVNGALSELALVTRCDSNGQRMFFVVEIDGAVSQRGRCSDVPVTAEDPGAGGSYTSARYDAGPHEVRIYTTDRARSEEAVAFDGAVVGAAAYRGRPDREVGASQVDELIEWDGRLWELTRPAGPTHRLDVDGPRVVGYVPDLTEDTWLEIRPEGGRARVGTGLQGGAGGYALTNLLWPGKPYDLSLVDQAGAPVGGEILVYRPVR